MLKVIVGSTNQVKLNAVQDAFARMFPGVDVQVGGLDVPSGVSDQPKTDWETYQGAVGRARAVQQQDPACDIAVGIEGGIKQIGLDLAAFAWAVLIGRDRVGKGRSGLFILPPAVAELVHAGKELGHADDIVFGRSDSKRKNGAVGLLTDDVIDRRSYYEHMVILGLIPFLRTEHYPVVRPERVYHLAEKAVYEQFLKTGVYRCDSLDSEGFIHCSTAGQVEGVANRFCNGGGRMMLLEVEPLFLDAPLLYEQAPDAEEFFPHVYGPIARRAIVSVTARV
ncbi:MAG: inosine/xanthosine triphosphatase [Anaerolineales bacterium]|nr:inosine/xanthosine triphosphatase [Anaerolineales bacterium]